MPLPGEEWVVVVFYLLRKRNGIRLEREAPRGGAGKSFCVVLGGDGSLVGCSWGLF